MEQRTRQVGLQMPECLLGLGSNVGDREATLSAALADIDALPDLRLIRRSGWHRFEPLGSDAEQGDYLNAAAVVATTIPPLRLLSELQGIESRHGRQRDQRWGPRTLDIDILLYGNEVSETEMLTLPHLRMSFRRFALNPAAEIAPRMLHPTIGWSLERLLLHLDSASDEAAVLSLSENLRNDVCQEVVDRFGAELVERPAFPTADQHWPASVTSWLKLPQPTPVTKPTAKKGGLPYAAAAFPKLTILLDARSQSPTVRQSDWSVIVRRPGSGPTLRLQLADRAAIRAEVFAAVESVWPDLG